MMKKPSVLFLSNRNSVRSPLAEAMLAQLAGERFEVMSAGVFPEKVHAFTHLVLDEIGIDSSRLTAKSVRHFLARSVVHVAIILGDDGPANPRMYPFAPSTLRWLFEDPLERPGTDEELMARFRRTRDAIRARLEAWLKEQDASEELGALTLQESALA